MHVEGWLRARQHSTLLLQSSSEGEAPVPEIHRGGSVAGSRNFLFQLLALLQFWAEIVRGTSSEKPSLLAVVSSSSPSLPFLVTGLFAR